MKKSEVTQEPGTNQPVFCSMPIQAEKIRTVNEPPQWVRAQGWLLGLSSEVTK